MNIARYVLKFVAAAFTALFILSIFTCVYDQVPLHIPNEDRTTDYAWPPHSRWVLLTEGIAWGKLDGKGFNNRQWIPAPDILFMGSSHIEAKNVMPEENACSLLEKKFNGRYKVYNIGMSGHDFFKVCHYIPYVFHHYSKSPPKFLVIETSAVNISDEKADEILQNRYKYRPVRPGRISMLLLRIPAVRFLYRRWTNGLKEIFLPGKNRRKAAKTVSGELSPAAYDRLFRYLAESAAKYHTKIIIFYHPRETFHADGSISFIANEGAELFGKFAVRHGISFIDLSKSFKNMFYIDRHVPHGFINGRIGKGHLNKYGHEAAAKEISRIIDSLTGGSK